MKTQIVFFVVALFALPQLSNGQTDQENLDKYWTYRDRLRKNFLKIGTDEGESLPMSSRSIGWVFGDQHLTEWADASAVYWGDATIELGHYLVMLATEYKLTKNQLINEPLGTDVYAALLQQKQQTLNELYYAMMALKRIDRGAEDYLNQTAGTPNENGFLLRDDVPSASPRCSFEAM